MAVAVGIRVGMCGIPIVSIDGYIYRCNQKYKGKNKCDTPSLKDKQIHSWSIQAINQVIADKDEIIQNMELLIKILENTDDLIEEIKNLEFEMEDIGEQAEKIVQRNTKVIQNQEIYQREYDELVARYENLQSQLLEKQSTLQLKRKQSADVKMFIELLSNQEHIITEFDEKLFNTLVEKIIVYAKEKAEVHFKNGQIIEI